MSIPPVSPYTLVQQINVLNKPVEMDIQHVNPQVNVSYHPAEMTIKTRSPEVQVDMKPVWDSLNLKGPAELTAERSANTTRKFYENIEQTVKDGDRVRNIVSGEKNVFGDIAIDHINRKAQVQTQLGLMPDRGPIFHAQVYSPEIHVELRNPEVQTNDMRPKFTFKQGSYTTHSVINLTV